MIFTDIFDEGDSVDIYWHEIRGDTVVYVYNPVGCFRPVEIVVSPPGHGRRDGLCGHLCKYSQMNCSICHLNKRRTNNDNEVY